MSIFDRYTIHFSYRFFFNCSGDHRDLHSFPTRRSSDLARLLRPVCRNQRGDDVELAALGSGQRDRGIGLVDELDVGDREDRKSTRLNSSHVSISYAVFCLKKKTTLITQTQ